MTKKLSYLINKTAINGLKAQRKGGEMVAGHNGPYFDQESPVRNTSHWILIWASQIKEKNGSDFICAINRATDYLIDLCNHKNKGSIACRTNPNKDSSNGLIGQAWLFEGLIASSIATGRSDARNIALNIFNQHKFDYSKGVWHRLGSDGSVIGIDNTFNHQLWFAAIASSFNDADANNKVSIFLDLVGTKVSLYPNGLIFHLSKFGRDSIKDYSNIKYVKTRIKILFLYLSNLEIYYKSTGYHAFNLYAFSILKDKFPNNVFWKSRKIQKMLQLTTSKRFVNNLNASEYGWKYNPSGVELAYVGEAFNLGHEYCQKWINLQIRHTYNAEEMNLLTKNVPDVRTSMARNYEFTRLKEEYFFNNDK